MKKFVVALLGFTPLFAAGQINVQWEARYSSAGANIDQAVDMVVDANGDSYVTGTSFNAGTGFDLVTIKYTANGNQDWIHTYNGPANSIDEAQAIALGVDGSVYVIGYVHVGGADYDQIILKLDTANGNLIWDTQLNYQNYYDIGTDLAIDGNGDCYFIGYGQFNPSGNDTDYLFGKLSINGNILWTDTYSEDIGSPTELDEGRTLALSGDKVYFTGLSGGASTVNNFDFVTMEYDTNQTVPAYNWRSRHDYNGNLDVPVAVDVDASGNVYVAGRGYYNALQDVDYNLVKYNSAGVEQWVRAYNDSTGASDKDNLNAMVIDAAGNVIVTGSSIRAANAEDFYTIKYDGNGNELWSVRSGVTGTFLDEGTDMQIGSSGDIFVTGYSFVTGNDHDFTTIKYDQNTGAEIWKIHYDGTSNNSDKALAMHVDPLENIFITGTSDGTGSAQDYMTIKYCQLTTTASSDTGVCVGESVTLNASAPGGTTYTWDVISGDPINIGTNFSCNPCASPVATPSVTTTYSVFATNASGCTDYDTVTVTINPLPGPVIYSSGPINFCQGDSVILYTDPASGYDWQPGGETTDSITVIASGTYTLTVQDSMGCQNSTAQGVNVFALPAIDAGVPDSLCLGDSTQLMASGGVMYWWTSDPELSDTTVADPHATPGGAGTSTYYVLGEDANGCQNWDSVDVFVHTPPTAPTITHLQPNEQLISSSASGNQWYLNGVIMTDSTGQVLNYNANGDYTLLYTDGNGCTVWSNDTVSIDSCCLGIVEQLFSSSNLYPNPNNGNFMLQLSSLKDLDVDIRILDITGKAILTRGNVRVAGEVNLEFNLEGVERGYYLLQIISEQGIVGKTFVIH